MLWWAVMLFVMLPLTLAVVLNNTPALVSRCRSAACFAKQQGFAFNFFPHPSAFLRSTCFCRAVGATGADVE